MTISVRLLNGRYRLSAPAHTGGMAEIYESRDILTDAKVAIKLFTSGHLEMDVLRESYQRELLALSQLKHPSIVQLLGHGEDAETGHPYLVLEWVDTDLKRLLQKTAFKEWDRLYWSIARPILGGLRFAHSRDFIHRDIKPSNVLVDAGGNPRLTDFGISKLKTYLNAGITLSRFSSPPYCPPEVDDGSYSATRDVFGIAAVLVECVAESGLTNYQELYSALDHAPFPLLVHNTFRRALDSDPSKRQPNAAVLLAELDSIQEFRGAEAVSRDQIFVELSPKAIKALFAVYPTRTRNEVEAALLNDINVVCGINSNTDASKNQSESITIYGGSFICNAYVAFPDEDRLFIANVAQVSPTLAEKRREMAMTNLNIVFRPGRPDAGFSGREVILKLREQLEQFRLLQAARTAKKKEEELFRLWSAILKAKTWIEKGKENPIKYHGYDVKGNRIVFTISGAPVGDLTGQARLVKADDLVRVTGEVEHATNAETAIEVKSWRMPWKSLPIS